MIGHNVMRAYPDEFNFVVSLKRINNTNQHRRESDHESTGSLITKKDIIITAHSFEFTQNTGFEIIVGSVDLRNGRIYYPAWWLTYTQWTIINGLSIENEVNDIAIIRVNAFYFFFIKTL
jgi:hypothetical protein